MTIIDVEYYETKTIPDNRGSFTKLFSDIWGDRKTLIMSEIFTSNSNKGVVRGMHLQIGKSANWRVVSVLSGTVFDVLIDLRQNSDTYGLTISKILESQGLSTVLIPPGVAHGFQALENATLLYATTSAYDFDHDTGVSVSSLDIDWPIASVIQSDRDKSLPDISEWNCGKIIA
jgi:dTDP-4-dehydrorhamnose 3,5-epimerase